MKQKHIPIDTITCFVIFFCIGYALLHIPFLSIIPTNNANVYYDGVFALLNHHLNPFVLFEGYKPPMLFLFTALVFRFFSPSLIIGGIISAMSASLALWFTYRLGSVLFSKKAGVAATLMLGVLPLFLSHSLQFTDAIFVTPMLLAGMYYVYKNNKIGYVVSMTLAVLTRETSVFLPILLILFELIKKLQSEKKFIDIPFKKSIFLALPLVPFIIWMFINKKIFGWYLWPDNVNYFSLNLMMILNHIAGHIKVVLIDCGAILFLFWIVLFIFLGKKLRTTPEQRHATIVFLTFAIINFLLVTSGPYHPRYMFFIYPFLSMLAGGALYSIFKQKTATILIAGIIGLFCLFQTMLWILPLRYWGESDLSIIHMATLYSTSFQKIHSQFPNALIATIPRIYPFSDTSFGLAKNNSTYNTYLWNDAIPKEQELINVCKYARERSLSPIIFIHESEVGDPVDGIQNKLLIEKVSTYTKSTSYHLLYTLPCPTTK